MQIKTMSISPHTCQNGLSSTRQKQQRWLRDVYEKETSYTADGHVIGTATVEDRKTKNGTTIRPSNFTSIHLKKTKTLIQKGTGTTMSTATLFTIAKIRKSSKCPSTHGQIKKMNGYRTQS